MRALLFAILTLGQLFVLRTQHKFAERALIARDSLTKIGTATLILVFWIAFSFNPTQASVFCGAVFVCFPLILRLLEERELRRIRSSLPIFIDRWILNLRLGLAAFHAREEVLKNMDPKFAKMMKTLLLDNQSPSECFLFERATVRALKNIANSPISTLNRLENLRESLKKSSEFRRRSGQALMQTRIQSLLMLLLLLAFSFLALKRYGWARIGDLLGISTSLALIGVVLIQFFARKGRWKV